MELHRAFVPSSLHFSPSTSSLELFLVRFASSSPERNALATPAGVTVERPNVRFILVEPPVESTAPERNKETTPE